MVGLSESDFMLMTLEKERENTRFACCNSLVLECSSVNHGIVNYNLSSLKTCGRFLSSTSVTLSQ